MRLARLSLLVGLLFSVVVAQPVAAFDEQFYAGNDILFYNPNGNGCEDGLVSVGLVGKDNLEKIFNYLVSEDKGLSDVQAAAVIGNISVESGGDPTLAQGGIPKNTNDDLPLSKWVFDEKHVKDPSVYGSEAGVGKAWGLIQWDAGGRAIDYAEDAGVSGEIYRLGTQLDIIWWHMNNRSPTSKTSMITEFKKITDLEKATLYYEQTMEGAGKPNMVDRYASAKLALAEFGGSLATSSASSTDIPLGSCEGVGGGAVAGNVAKTAISYAWPEYHAPNYLRLKPAYASAISQAQAKGKYVGGGIHPGVDCGGFVTRVLQDSGVDPSYGGGGNTTSQLAYLASSSKYKELVNPSTSDLDTGRGGFAIAIKTTGGGHTYLYIGKKDGFETQVASASYSPSGTAWRSPMAGLEAPADSEYRWFVLR